MNEPNGTQENILHNIQINLSHDGVFDMKIMDNGITAGYHVEIDNVHKTLWSKLLVQFDDASIYQTWSYAAVLYGAENLGHLILKKDEEVIAIAQVGIMRVLTLATGTANIHWGPLWKKKDCELKPDNLIYMIKALKNEFAVKRGLLLRIWPHEIKNPKNSVRMILENSDFIYNSSAAQYRTFKLSLTPTLEELRKNLNQKWRNQLNRAEKNNLKVLDGSGEDMYETFLMLQREMLARKKYTTDVDYDEYRVIQNDLPESLKLKIMVCEHEGVPISVAICSAISNTGIYLLGASGDKGMGLNGSNLLQWEMIKWFKEQGCHWYDLGGIDPEINPGVYRFKRGVAGKIGKDEKHIGQFDFYNNLRAHFLYFLINKKRFIWKKLAELRK